MATFIDLCNTTLRRFNEVELTSANFASAIGFYAQVKDAVNATLQRIHNEGVYWPWGWATYTQVLTPITTRYNFPTDLRAPNMKSFRLRADSSIPVSTTFLEEVPYDEYLRNYVNQEDYTLVSQGRVPWGVFQADNQQWGVVGAPNKAYSVTFEYYTNFTPLVNYSDTTVVPDAYKYTVIDGASMLSHLFRENDNGAALAEKLYEEGMKAMRKVNINHTEAMSPTITFGR